MLYDFLHTPEAQFWLLALIATITGYSLYQINKISQLNREYIPLIHRETGALFNQLQALMALEKKLGMIEALPSMRGWAGSPDFLLRIADELTRRKPRMVFECSSGVSTVVVARCLQMHGFGHVYSLEHDQEFAEKSRQLIARYGLENWATVLDAPLVNTNPNSPTPWYDESAIPSDMPPIEMLIIDGPPYWTAPLARYPALPMLISRLADHCIIIMDDADRHNEREILRRWKIEFPDFQYTDAGCEKGCALLER